MPILGVGVMPWMSSAWPTSPQAIGGTQRDINGVAITVGATVKFVGTVVAINDDPHFGNIIVAPAHPDGQATVFSPGQGLPRDASFVMPNPQKPVGNRGFQPLELVVGS